jgi:hypothetical protein
MGRSCNTHERYENTYKMLIEKPGNLDEMRGHYKEPKEVRYNCVYWIHLAQDREQ